MKKRIVVGIIIIVVLILGVANVLGGNSIYYLTKGQADSLYCAITGSGCGGGNTSTESPGTVILMQNSMKQNVYLNVSDSDGDNYTFYVYDEVTIIPINGAIE